MFWWGVLVGFVLASAVMVALVMWFGRQFGG